jgi:hypothetical protein
MYTVRCLYTPKLRLFFGIPGFLNRTIPNMFRNLSVSSRLPVTERAWCRVQISRLLTLKIGTKV